MPSRYGSHKTVRERHEKWNEEGGGGVWKRIMDFLISHAYRTTGLVNTDDDLSIDSRTVQLLPREGARGGL
ncbi:MAG TPA: hypothetical protein VNI77_02125 [Nitrososphaera sp.]|nr:hypothetical protein [Nitrososphaera sp.]